MSISSVSTQTPVYAPQQAQAQPTPVQNDKTQQDDSSQQVTKAALPPGQGTKVDQLA